MITCGSWRIKRTQRLGVSKILRQVDLRLTDHGQVILNRILHGAHADRWPGIVNDVGQGGVNGRGFSRSRRTGQEQ